MLTFNFPVFYHALVGADRHPPIFFTINLLLLGKTWESSHMAEIRSDVASGLKKGTRNISHPVLYNLEHESDEELLRRLNTLGKEKKRKALICLSWLVHDGILHINPDLSMALLMQRPSPDALLVRLFRASFEERSSILSDEDIACIYNFRERSDFPDCFLSQPSPAYPVSLAPSGVTLHKSKQNVTYASTIFLLFSWGTETISALRKMVPVPLSTLSLNSLFRELLNADIHEPLENLLNKNTLLICRRYFIPAEHIRAQFQQKSSQHLFVSDASNISPPPSCGESFWLEDSWLYILSDGLAILCLGIGYEDISAIRYIVSPGRSSSVARYWLEQDGIYTPFSMNDKIAALARFYGLDTLVSTQPFVLYDIFTLNMAFTSESFHTLDGIRKGSYNLHLFTSLDSDSTDISQASPSYVYADTSKGKGTCRWGCCIGILDMGCVYSLSDPADASTGKEEVADGIMPLIVLTLQQRYIYNHLLEQLRLCRPDDKAAFLEIKSDYIRAMTRFFEPAEVSSWDNICNLYGFLVKNLQIKTFSEAISRRLCLIEG